MVTEALMCMHGRVWANVGYQWFYVACFDCKAPYTDCGSMTIYLNFFYTGIITLLGTVVVPALWEDEHDMMNMPPYYVRSVMPKDERQLKLARVQNSVIESFFAVGIGWSWTTIFATECTQNWTPTCPDELTLSSVFLYLFFVVLYDMLYFLCPKNQFTSSRDPILTFGGRFSISRRSN